MEVGNRIPDELREFLEETGVKPLKCRLISTLILTGQEKYLYKIKKFDDSRMFTKPESQRVGPPFWIPEDVVKDAKVIFHAHAWIYLEFMKIGIRIDSSATARVI